MQKKLSHSLKQQLTQYSKKSKVSKKVSKPRNQCFKIRQKAHCCRLPVRYIGSIISVVGKSTVEIMEPF